MFIKAPKTKAERIAVNFINILSKVFDYTISIEYAINTQDKSSQIEKN